MPISRNDLKKLNEYAWEIPEGFRPDMRVPAKFFVREDMLDEIFRDRSLEQLVNVASLPGIIGSALAMPDVHEGYGFPIGGVAATKISDGVISPGGIGYDINCGVRLLRSEMKFEDIKDGTGELAQALFRAVPSGIGRGGGLNLGSRELDDVLINGAEWMVQKGYGGKEDLERIESGGRFLEADSRLVSEHAKKRGRDQAGTMGAGNHFVEVDVVEKIFDREYADRFGLFENQIAVLIHTGSRGLGHQIATDYIRLMVAGLDKFGIKLPDLELACAPFSSPEGQNYFAAMSAGANFAWANRQMISWRVREVWKKFFGGQKLDLVYDVAHNIAKIEEHKISGKKEKLVVHRKGATRAFPGQAVLIPGSMGTASYVLVGAEGAMRESFGSACHGAGRRMSRHQALKEKSGREVGGELEARGIAVASGSMRGLAEEAPFAYKDVDEVVEVVCGAGLAKAVARLRPVAVIKG